MVVLTTKMPEWVPFETGKSARSSASVRSKNPHILSLGITGSESVMLMGAAETVIEVNAKAKKSEKDLSIRSL